MPNRVPCIEFVEIVPVHIRPKLAVQICRLPMDLHAATEADRNCAIVRAYSETVEETDEE